MLTERQIREMTLNELIITWIRIGNAMLDKMELPAPAAPGIAPADPEPPPLDRRTVRGSVP